MSLSALPTELLELIASYLDLPSLRSVRLTSSPYRTQTIHIFRHRFFTTQTLSWTKSSLQRLIDISAHPELGDALHNLIIDATPRFSLAMWKRRRRSSDAGHFDLMTDDEEDGSKLIQRLGNEHEISEQEAEATSKWLNESRFDIISLRTVFSRVKELKSITFAYTGMDMGYSKFAQRYCESSQHEMSRPFVSTMAALAASNIAVKEIKVIKDKSYGAISVGRLETLAPSLRSFDTVFEALEVLQLKLRDWRTPDEGFKLQSGRAPFSIRFLAKCRSVKVLDLDFHSCFEDDAFGELARVCRFERLECIKLELFRVKRGADLMDFLEPSKGCLREVRLRHVLLDDPESGWKEVVCNFAAEETGFQTIQVFHAERLFALQLDLVKRVFFREGESVTSVLRVEGEHWRDELGERGSRCLESMAGRTWENGAIAYPFVRSDST